MSTSIRQIFIIIHILWSELLLKNFQFIPFSLLFWHKLIVLKPRTSRAVLGQIWRLNIDGRLNTDTEAKCIISILSLSYVVIQQLHSTRLKPMITQYKRDKNKLFSTKYFYTTMIFPRKHCSLQLSEDPQYVVEKTINTCSCKSW